MGIKCNLPWCIINVKSRVPDFSLPNLIPGINLLFQIRIFTSWIKTTNIKHFIKAILINYMHILTNQMQGKTVWDLPDLLFGLHALGGTKANKDTRLPVDIISMPKVNS